MNIVESKELVFAPCEEADGHCIKTMSRKSGSITVAICNALIYSAADLLGPVARG